LTERHTPTDGRPDCGRTAPKSQVHIAGALVEFDGLARRYGRMRWQGPRDLPGAKSPE
jgi:hypothetical protein